MVCDFTVMKNIVLLYFIRVSCDLLHANVDCADVTECEGWHNSAL